MVLPLINLIALYVLDWRSLRVHLISGAEPDTAVAAAN